MKFKFETVSNLKMNTYDVIIHADKTQYCKVQQQKLNFRTDLTNHDLDEGIMLNFPFTNTYYSYKSNTTAIPLTRFFKRSGVIPYTVISGTKYYCLGVDARYGTLTDFGGRAKSSETFARTGSRELFEESLSIFRFGPVNLYNSTVSVYDNRMVIMFLRVNITDMSQTVKQFNDIYNRVGFSENCGIMWIKEDIFTDLIRSGKSVRVDGSIYPSVYKPVCELIRSVLNNNDIV